MSVLSIQTHGAFPVKVTLRENDIETLWACISAQNLQGMVP